MGRFGAKYFVIVSTFSAVRGIVYSHSPSLDPLLQISEFQFVLSHWKGTYLTFDQAETAKMASADNPSQRKAAIPSPARELFEPKRHGLIAQLVCAAKLTKLDSITWACLWFADLSELESLVSSCEWKSPYGYMMHRDLSKSEDKTQVIDACQWVVI